MARKVLKASCFEAIVTIAPGLGEVKPLLLSLVYTYYRRKGFAFSPILTMIFLVFRSSPGKLPAWHITGIIAAVLYTVGSRQTPSKLCLRLLSLVASLRTLTV